MSGKIALDTDVSIRFLNGDKSIESFLLKYSEIHMPVIVVGELIFGALNSTHAEHNLARHKKLIQRMKILEITEATANIYAKTRLSLKKKGKPIPENDLWIAAVCIDNKVPFLSNDEHFKEIEGLLLKGL
ncbi:MAG TPA: type II toxin-antitoxin system VapC family toxin [Thermodesulfovibrionales bacterium]|nr:type II toxin-antitoxin system VapC family toxin [Thermodesulfovibrionales bacterium]